MANLPPDLRFASALVLLGVVMFSVEPRTAAWMGGLLILAAVSYAQVSGAKSGHSFVSDVLQVFTPSGGSK